MLTYQVRQRLFRTDGTPFPAFPLEGEVRLHLGPQQPFGCQAGGGRTTVKNAAAQVSFNGNNGQSFVESDSPLQPLDVVLKAPDQVVRLNGSCLTVSQSFDSLDAVARLIDALYFALPALLAVEFADPPFVDRVDGALGGVPFRWELDAWSVQFLTTTQDSQEERFAQSWQRLSILSEQTNRRLFAALHYFHTAARLSRAGSVAGEFLPEVILNLSKVLEVLFPPRQSGEQPRDAARSQLAELGFTNDEIEGDYLPAMALRNGIDVGHVFLSLFKAEHLRIIHGYTERAEPAFRRLLSRVMMAVEDGSLSVAPYTDEGTSKTALNVVDRLRKFATP